MSNKFRSAANVNVRKLIDEHIAPLPYNSEINIDTIRKKVNKNRSRNYSNNSIAALVRERDDTKNTPNGWIKIKTPEQTTSEKGVTA